MFKSAPTCFGSERRHHQGALFVYIYIYIYIYTHAHIYIYTHTNRVNYTHTHTHTHAQPVRICYHYTDLDNVNRHYRIIIVIFSQALYKAA